MALNTEVLVVLPAAGIGSRTGVDLPKQYIEIEGRPVISHTIEKFLEYKEVVRIIIVVALEQIEFMQGIIDCIPKLFNQERIRIVRGAESRHKSIYLGLQCLNQEGYPSNSVVVVHDGVRPFLNKESFVKVINATQTHHASGIARNLVSTVISLDEKDMLKETLVRSKYKASEMPQAFTLSVILEAYKKCPENVMIFGTECLDIVHTYGDVVPKLILTDDTDSWKITYKMDLYTARDIIKAKQTVGIENGTLHKLLLNKLVSELNLIFDNVDSDCCLQTMAYSNYVIFHCDTLNNIIEADFNLDVDYRLEPLMIVHVIFGHQECSDFLSLQKKSRLLADKNLEKKMSCFYIVTDFDISDNNIIKMSKMISLLIFNGNQYLSGEIIYY